MTFYGPAGEDDLRGLYEHLQKIKEVYDRNHLPSFLADNLITLCRNLSFKEDPKFVSSLRNNCLDDDDWMKVWRLHTYCWAGKSALSVGGDLVECGVYKGLYSGTMAHYLDFETRDKRLYLYDTFEGLAEKYSTKTERGAVGQHYDADRAWVYGFVVDRFKKHPNVEVIKGIVPEILHETSSEEVALLHLDMNAGQAEESGRSRCCSTGSATAASC